MIRTYLFRYGLIPLIILIGLALIIGTPFGTRLLVVALDATLPMLSLQHRNGALTQKLELANFELTLNSVTVRLDEASIELRPACLLNQVLCVDTLAANGVEVIVPLNDESSASPDEARFQEPSEDASKQPNKQPMDAEVESEALSAYSGIPLPFTIDITQAQLSKVLVVVGGMSIRADELQTGLNFSPTRLWLDHSTIDQFSYRLPPSDELEPDNSANSNANHVEQPPAGPLAELSEVDLPFAIDVTSLAVDGGLVQTGELTQHFDWLEFSGYWHHHQLRLTDFNVIHDWSELAGSFGLTFSDNYPIEGVVTGTAAQLPWLPELQGLTFQATLSNSLQRPKVAISSRDEWHFDANVQMDLSQASLPFQGMLAAKSIHWPRLEPQQFSGRDLTVRFGGDFEQQHISGNGSVKVIDLPETKVMVAGSHQDGEIYLKQLNIDGGLGKAQGRGTVSFNQGYSWDFGLTSQHLDLSQIADELPLQLSGTVDTKGHFNNSQDWQFAFNHSDLHGQWQQYPLQVSGAGHLNSHWQGDAEQLTIAINGTDISLDGGIVDGQWQLHGQLNVPDTSVWLAETTGAVNAKLNMSGTAASPNISLNADAAKLSYQQISLEQTNATINYSPTQAHKTDIKINVADLFHDTQHLGSLDAHLFGSDQRQEAHIKLNGETKVNVGLGGNLYLEQQQWRGGLFYADFTRNHWQLKLNHLAGISFDLQRIEAIVDQHCWLARASKMCSRGPSLVGKRGAMAWDTEADLGRLLDPILPDRLKLNTELSGQIALNWSPQQEPALFARLNGSDGQLELERGLGLDNSAIGWHESVTAVTLREKQLNLETYFKVDDQQNMNLDLEVITENDYPLSGHFNAQNLDLAPFLAWVKQLSDGLMLLDGELNLGGTLTSPRLDGRLNLKEGKLSAITNPTELTDIDVIIDFDGDKGKFKGTTMVGEGLASVAGDLYWQGGFALAAQINGERLELLYPPMVQVTSSPKLYLIWAPQLFSLTGDVAIDDGAFKVETLPKGAVKVSDDVVFIDALSEQQQQAQQTTLDLDVRIDDQLEIDALGLTGSMGGELTVRKLPTQPIQIYGSLGLGDGKFDAYGQQLELKRGQVIFNGPPELPNIDVEAIREIDSEDLTVGVRVTGVPKAPKLTLFADRGMEQQEILSYLIRGQGLNSDGESSMWASAALSLGVGTTGGVVTTIGEEIGLNNVKLDAEGSGEDTQVTVSGYIGDKLFVKYGVGVFGESLNELTVRYYLAKRLWLETVSAVTEEDNENSLDIYYQFEIE